MNIFKAIGVIVATIFALAAVSFAGSVAVHDPSIVVAYKDANGHTFPENDATNSRTKLYYIFGTQLGAAYSTNMLNWTEFTPTFIVNGKITTDYYQAFKAAADWSNLAASDAVKGNLWAPDIIYNKKMKKWCLYFSVNGEDWMSSVTLHTADNIEGPYEYKGVVVYGGMDNQSVGKAGNLDYKKVTGENSINSRYFMSNSGKNLGKWDGGYGVSCIDPTVFYDENGTLWLLYGSWSGGLFLLKLDESTGLRDYAKSYGTEAVWNGSALQSDPYMGVHVGGGYYVSGEGSYIQYFTDANGNGYYYLFVSYGFYSPEGGYSMRVFRSKNVTGPYVDVDGTPAIFDRYVLNYWTNTDYGFPIIQNYKWSFWSNGNAEISDGHNSLLKDDDGSMYIVYHRKMDNNTAWHNVETHQLFFNKMGWIVAAPFEYHAGFGLPTLALNISDIAGAYKVIMHEPNTEKNPTASNQERDMQLNADGSVTGAYTGTWSYNFANGQNFLTLNIANTTFEGVALNQTQNDIGKSTITFSAMNKVGSRAFWGYKVPKTEILQTTKFYGETVGERDFSTAWDSYDKFKKVNVSGDFVAEFEFTNNIKKDAENWNNWVLVFTNESNKWYLRSDAYSVESFGENSVGYYTAWGNNWSAFKSMLNGANIRIRTEKCGNIINVFAFVKVAGKKDSLIYAATAKNTPNGNYEILLGVDAAFLDLHSIAYGALEERTIVGKIDAGGVYNSAFNTEKSADYKVSGDFDATLYFKNYGNGNGANNWDNYIVKATAENSTTLLRADAYALDNAGQFKYETDWNWDNFASIMHNAYVKMNISRKNDVITYNAKITDENGHIYNYKATNTGASTKDMQIGLTCEKSAVDLLSVSVNKIVGDSTKNDETTTFKTKNNFASNLFKIESDILKLNLPNANNITLSIFNILGKRVLMQKIANNSQQISLKKLPQGNYILKLNVNKATIFNYIILKKEK